MPNSWRAHLSSSDELRLPGITLAPSFPSHLTHSSQLSGPDGAASELWHVRLPPASHSSANWRLRASCARWEPRKLPLMREMPSASAADVPPCALPLPRRPAARMSMAALLPPWDPPVGWRAPMGEPPAAAAAAIAPRASVPPLMLPFSVAAPWCVTSLSSKNLRGIRRTTCSHGALL